MSSGSALEPILRLLAPGMRVLLHAGPAECLALRDALAADPQRAAGVTFTGLFVPGANSFDYAGLTASTFTETLFAAPSARESFAAGRLNLLPIHYSSFPTFLARHPADLAILHLPPAQDGRFSCGVAADIAEGVERFARQVAVIVNPQIPVTAGGIALAADAAAVTVEADGPLLAYANGGDDAVLARIAAHVAALVEDGDVLQVGIGKLPSAVLRRVTDRRRLRLHSGMLIDEAAGLLAADALAPSTPDAPALLAGIALGGEAVRALAAHGNVRMHGIAVTHDVTRIARLPRFTAINSALEVDLFGNVNCERVNGRQVSGIGGAGDFAVGARLAPDGRAIVALPSEAKGQSRILPALGPGHTSIARAELDILVTEHGTARLRDLGLEARAQAIIGLAAPAHRPALAEAWRAFRAGSARPAA